LTTVRETSHFAPNAWPAVIAKLLSKDEARRIAAHVAKLPCPTPATFSLAQKRFFSEFREHVRVRGVRTMQRYVPTLEWPTTKDEHRATVRAVLPGNNMIVALGAVKCPTPRRRM
jgi:hypothetical protein